MDAQRTEIRFLANRDGFAGAFARLRAALDAEQLDGAARYNAELVFEEIVSNIVNYGTTDGVEPTVCVRLEVRADAVDLTFDDNGPAFNPCVHTGAAPARSLEDDRIGGYGLMLVRKVSSTLTYQRTLHGHNQLAATIQR